MLRQRLEKLAAIMVVLLAGVASFATEFHVAKTGSDTNDGSALQPFVTISAAARLAMPGDVVTVHAGTYREWVSPLQGGQSDIARIVYQAAPGEVVNIKGSEVVRNWEKVKDGVWKVTLPNTLFGDYNPYADVIYGDWFNNLGWDQHTGEVYLNGKSLYEVDAVAKVERPAALKNAKDQAGSLFVWHAKVDESTTTIWANFHERDPNQDLVEINVRPVCFFPKTTGVNYITVRGFIMSQAATQWAPPTAEQSGLIGAHWSKGWIIENNVISDSKCSGISLGKGLAGGHNYGSILKMKSGFQYQLEAVFKALQMGWNKDNVGSHIVRNNVIFNCEQAGIVGHMGAAFSQIYSNHIYNIWTKRQFDGAELGGIKFHAAIDTLIKHNRIHDCGLAIWLDWQAQGTRVSGNLLYNNEKDLMVEVCHGPYLVDNNIMLSPFSLDIYSSGGAFVHNFISGKTSLNTVLNRATPYHFPHSTAVAGTAPIVGGDDRYYNNVFAINYADKLVKPLLDPTKPESGSANQTKCESYGLAAYDAYPASLEEFKNQLELAGGFTVSAFSKARQPVYIASNLYLNNGMPYDKEAGFIRNDRVNPDVRIEDLPDGVYLHIYLDDSFAKMKTKQVTSQLLGMPRIVGAAYENPDGSPLVIDTDYFGTKRSETNPTIGPMEALGQGNQRIKVW